MSPAQTGAAEQPSEDRPNASIGTESGTDKAGPAERFLPDQMRGRLVESEHISRYLFAAQLAPSRRILDAACGTGYGTALLARAGAKGCVGIDVDPKAASGEASPGCEFVEGSITQLPFADGEFDLVVCFEAIEHVEDYAAALDELVRVLGKENGLLIISTPNRGIYPPGNPFHKRELTAAELVTALQQRLANVRPLRQHNWLASAIFNDDDFASDDPRQPLDVETSKIHAAEPGRELYTLAIAGNGALPAVDGVALMTQGLEVREWLAQIEQGDAAARRADELQSELTETRANFDAQLNELQEQIAWVEENELFLREAAARSSLVRFALRCWSTARKVTRRARRILRR
ncbi:MAG: class I SAM-dependent methyltransferase [Solirubrobacterales bacterium]